VPTQPYKIVPSKKLVDPTLAEVMGINGSAAPIKIPGTTTVIGRFKDSGALIYWANKEGLEGRPIRGPESASAQACDIGTLAHAMVEADIRGTTPPNLKEFADEWRRRLRAAIVVPSESDRPLRENFETELEFNEALEAYEDAVLSAKNAIEAIPKTVASMVKKAKSSFSAYLEWKGQSSLKPVLTELSLTSKRWLFGGTLDAVQIGGRIAMLDWKTSNGIYQDHIIQVAGGYAILWEENYPDMPIDGGFHILRFSKEDGGFTHHFWPEIEGAKEAFIHMRILYELDRKLKGRL